MKRDSGGGQEAKVGARKNQLWQLRVPCPAPRLPGGPIPQVLNGEVYPPSVEEAPVLMHYPKGIPPQNQMAVGQEVFGLLPGLMLYATIWLREHNRVCDLLKTEHPTWDDEQLFQTTRLILIGEGSEPAMPRMAT